MAFNQFNCSEADVITGVTQECSFESGPIKKLFLTDTTYSIDTIDNAKLEATWDTDIEAKKVLPLPLVQEYDDNSEDDTYWTSGITSLDTFIREGKTNFKFRILFDPCLYKRLRQLNGSKKRFIHSDSNNNVHGTTPDNTVFKGLLLSTLRVEKYVVSDGSTPSFIPIQITIESGIERNDQIAVFKVDWDISAKNGVQPAVLTIVGTPTTTEIVVDVTQFCDGVGIEGLTADDFVFLEPGGAEETITTAIPVTGVPGRYTLSATAFVSLGTLNLRGVVSVLDQFYQGTAVIVTIV